MKGKKATILVLAMLLSLSAPTAFSKNDKFSVDYVFEPIVDECGQWLIKDTMILSVPGLPLVPYKAASILLPGSTELKDVKVKYGKPIIQSGFDLPWGQPPCTFSDTPVIVGRNEEIYNSDNLYPNKMFEVVGVDYCKGFAILNVHLYPVQYQAKSQTVHFYEKLTVEVQVGKGVKNKLYRGLEADKKDVAGIVSNPEMVDTYDDGPQPLATEEYIIITNDTMQPTFQTLANHKAAYVNGATVYTVSWISSNYSGTDTPMKMRNFIIDKYTYNGLKYVLLGGDVAAVPYRGFYVSTGGYTDSDMLADMYFAHLDGSHNSDGDSYYGETNDGVDFGAEVAVGRAPCQSVTEAQNFVNKVIAYEQADKPKRVLLHESRVQAGNVPDARCLAYNCDNYIPGDYVIDYVFEEDAGGVSKSRWISRWALNPVAVAHIGHGNTDVYYINYEKDIGTVSWYNSDVASMTNTFWPWTTSVACITGQIEANDCLSEAYVMDANNGAIAAIYNDNYGWFNTSNACALSGEFCEMEFRACWNDGMQKLGDMLNKARSYLASSAQSDSYYRWCFYERNLVGDPESPCLTKRGGVPNDTVTITNPSNGSTVIGTVPINVSYTGSINEVRFYIDGTLKNTDYTAPFSWNWDTTTYPDGSHTIRVDGYVSGVFADDDTVTVTVDNNPGYYVTITNPSENETVFCIVSCTATSNCTSVRWYIDGTYVAEDTSAPFQYNWDTTAYSDGNHTIEAEGYVIGVLHAEDSVTCNVDNTNPPPSTVTITTPANGSEVYEIVNIAVSTTGCIDEVEFFIDGTSKSTDTTPPFEYDWDTAGYGEDQQHTILVNGYFWGVLKDTDSITVTVNNIYIKITNPQHEKEVSDKVPITVDTRGIDIVQFYIDDYCLGTDCEAPFEHEWDTNGYGEDKQYTICVKGFTNDQIPNCSEQLSSYSEQPGILPIEPKDIDCIDVTVNNIYVTITNPSEGEEVSGTVTIEVDARGIEKVKFYVNGLYKGEDNVEPFQYNWDTTPYPEDQNATVEVRGYVGIVCLDIYSITVTVNNIYVKITNPQEGEVSGTVTITVDTRGIDIVQFYIDDYCLGTDCEAPFEHEWDTNGYGEDEQYTICVKGFTNDQIPNCSEQLSSYSEQPGILPIEPKDIDCIDVTVNNIYVTITNPPEGEEVSGTCLITTDTEGIDTVRFYIDDVNNPCECEDTEEPFECNWDTTGYSDGSHTIIARGYALGDFQDQDSVTCTVCNGSAGLWLGILVGCAGITKRRH